MNNTVYLYIPREKLLNSTSRKHRNNKFKKLYYYKNKKLHQFNETSIQEIDIFKLETIQTETLYKDNYKSLHDKYFDHYKVLKPEYNNCDEIYIDKTKFENNKDDKDYKKNKKKQLIKKINYNNRIKMKSNPENFVLDWS